MLRLQRSLLIASAAHSSAFRVPTHATTIGSALSAAIDAFASSDVPEPELSAAHLLARCAGYGNDRSKLNLFADEPIDPRSRAMFEDMCSRRLKDREPVQYILGDWDFCDLTLLLRPPVLIPRPETEELVEHVLRAHDGEELDYLDIGCGSGAIGLALLSQRRAAQCAAIDINPVAVQLANDNAARCGLAKRYTAELIEGGIVEYAAPSKQNASLPEEDHRRFDVIVSNPPYIPAADMATLAPEVVAHEDEAALVGGDDGLDIVREVLRAAPHLLKPDGPRTIWLEIDPSHPPLIDEWLQAPQQAGMQLVMEQWLPDASGLPRFVQVVWHP